ncbi:MAG: fibronectin type III domain-containing protein [Beijerinckiaceae bacterium]|nr:fibronectin type III domain-containing protein [Beijerinckiaceae bacterium]
MIAGVAASTAITPSTIADLVVVDSTSSALSIAYSPSRGGLLYQYRLDGGAAQEFTVPDTIDGLSPSTSYDVQVRAQSVDGVFSAWSNVATGATDAGTGDVAWNTGDDAGAITYSNADLTATVSATDFDSKTGRATLSRSTGKWFFSATFGQITSNDDVGFNKETTGLGIANASHSFVSDFPGASPFNAMLVYASDGGLYGGSFNGPLLGELFSGDVVDLVVDVDAQLLWARKNGGDWNDSPTADPEAGDEGFDCYGEFPPGAVFPLFLLYANGDNLTANFGASSFTYAKPATIPAWDGTA